MLLRESVWGWYDRCGVAVALFLWVAWTIAGVTACKKDSPPPSEIAESAVTDGGSRSAPGPAEEAKPSSKAEQRPEKLAQPAAASVIEGEEATPLAPEVAEPPIEPSEVLEKAARTTLELGELLSKMLQEMKPHGDDAQKMVSVQERFQPAIDEAVKRGEALVSMLTQGEKILLQQHATSVLQTISEDFVGLPAEAVVPIVDVLFRMVGVETQHQFD